jgi:hypothetical protein
MNSPLIRRKKKSHNNSSDIDCKENTAPKCQENATGEKKKKTSTLSNEQVLIEDDPFAFNLLMNNDSDSDDDSCESPDSSLGTSSQASKERREVYHNLETFQKRQLKQKV